MSLRSKRWVLSFENVSSPFAVLLFLYFSTTCAELVGVTVIIFKLKLNFLVGVLLFLFFSRQLLVIKQYFYAFLFLLVSVIASGVNSPNLIAWSGFLFFYIFTYVVYFVFPASLLQTDCSTVMRMYTRSFIVLGAYSCAQVLCSFFGIMLPFVTQTVGVFARGQAWAYEPSFFALYMTPFIAFENARYLLMPEKRDRLVFIYNLMFLSSTSTGCFFTYVWMLFLLIYLLRKNEPKKWKKTIFKYFSFLVSAFGIMALFFRDGFNSFFKFFREGFSTHYSFSVRWAGLVRCLDIFMDHPFLGVGLGGISSYSAEKHFGKELDVLDPEVLQTYPGMNVTTEVLANLGLLGVVGFIYLFYLIYRDFSRTMQISTLTKEERVNLQAFAFSLCVTAFTYQFSQSIMRSYMWVHVAICVGYAHFLQKRHGTIALKRCYKLSEIARGSEGL